MLFQLPCAVGFGIGLFVAVLCIGSKHSTPPSLLSTYIASNSKPTPTPQAEAIKYNWKKLQNFYFMWSLEQYKKRKKHIICKLLCKCYAKKGSENEFITFGCVRVWMAIFWTTFLFMIFFCVVLNVFFFFCDGGNNIIFFPMILWNLWYL